MTPEKRAAFLASLGEGDTVKHAAALVGVSRTCLYEVRLVEQAFADAWDRALDEGTEALEQEAKRRAVDGVEEPVYYQGDVVGLVRKYSDTLLMFLLNGRVPEKYKQRHEHAGPKGGPIGVRHSIGTGNGDDFDFGDFAATFALVADGRGPGRALAAVESLDQSLDTADADVEAGAVPHGSDA